MHAVTTTLIAVQQLLSYPSAIALVVLLFFSWRRLRVTGFLIVAIGGSLNLLARVFQSFVPPFPMVNMPFSHARALRDLSRAPEFIFIYSCHVLASLLIVVGTVMAIRAWSATRTP